MVVFFNDPATAESYTSDTLCPYTTLFRSAHPHAERGRESADEHRRAAGCRACRSLFGPDHHRGNRIIGHMAAMPRLIARLCIRPSVRIVTGTLRTTGPRR